MLASSHFSESCVLFLKKQHMTFSGSCVELFSKSVELSSLNTAFHLQNSAITFRKHPTFLGKISQIYLLLLGGTTSNWFFLLHSTRYLLLNIFQWQISLTLRIMLIKIRKTRWSSKIGKLRDNTAVSSFQRKLYVKIIFH